MAGDLDSRKAVRGVNPAAANSPSNCGLVNPVLRYSIIVGSVPEALMMASTLREVSQSGL